MQTYDPDKNKTEVRQGNARRMNLRVLVASLVAIVLVFVVLYLLWGTMQPPAAG